MRLGAQLLVCAVFAAIPALAVGYVALDHNPQGEFAAVDTGIYTRELFGLVGLTWTLVALPLMGLVALIDIGRRGDS